MNDIPETSPVRALVAIRRFAKFDFEFYPKLWERRGYARVMKKVKWTSVYYSEESASHIPKESGVYMFVVAPQHAYVKDHTYIFYVGQAMNLHVRYSQYLREELGEHLESDRERIVDFLNYFQGYIYFKYFICDRSELDTREDYLVDHIYPWANTRHNKKAKAYLSKPEKVV